MSGPIAVMPVLVGPLQVLLALLPAILAALGGMLLALFKPSGFKRLVRFFWHQKLFTALLIAVGVALWHGYPRRLWSGTRSAGAVSEVSDEARGATWPMLRGGPDRMGWSGGDDATAPAAVWSWADHKTVYGSPTVAGGRVYFSTVTDIGPFTPHGKGAVVCCDAETGHELWRYDDGGNMRATFSAPVVAEERIVVGEGLHITEDARVTCLDLTGRKVWEHRAKSHVEATPCIRDGRVYVSAADDGFYCFALAPRDDGAARVLWHLSGPDYADCESSPVSDGKTVWFGLGEMGNAVVAVDAVTGEEQWRAATPHPVFTGPTLSGGKLFVGVGNGNFIASAEEIRARTLEEMREAGAPPAEIEAASKELAPYGAVWCLDASTGRVDWQFPLKETVLDSIACRDGRLYFGARDGTFYALSTEGKELARRNAGAIILASAAAGRSHVYVVTNAGRLHCLKADNLEPVWDMALQPAGVMSSSPTLAGGHVYVGTDASGMRCVGTTEPPEPPVWTGRLQDSAKDASIPDQPEVAWTYRPPDVPTPLGGIQPFELGAPMMALGDSLFFLVSRPAGKEALNEAVKSLVRLRCTGRFAEQPKVDWTCDDVGRTSGLLGSGDRILCVDDSEVDEGGPRIVSCHRASDGTLIWGMQTAKAQTEPEKTATTLNPPTGGWTVDRERVYVCGPRRLTALNLQDGASLWTRDLPSPHGRAYGLGLIAEADGLLVVAATDSLAALDAATGRELWRREFEGSELLDAPLVGARDIVLKTRTKLTSLSTIDGKLRWQKARSAGGVYYSPIGATAEFVIGDSTFKSPIPLLARESGEAVGDLPPRRSLPEEHDDLHVLGNRVLYVGGETIRIHDLITGETSNWASDERLRGGWSLCALGGHVFLATEKHGIVCLRGAQP